MPDDIKAAPPGSTEAGYVDIYGYSTALGGFVVGGWIDFSWNDQAELPPLLLDIDDQRLNASGTMCLYQRGDVADRGMGYVLFAGAENAPQGALTLVTLTDGLRDFRLIPSSSVQVFAEDALFHHVKHFLNTAAPNDARAHLRKLVGRSHFNGNNTLAQAKWPVHLEIDQVYFCPPRGLLVRGWLLDPFHQIIGIKAHCGRIARVLDRSLWVAIKRQDVTDGFAATYGSLDEHCGFLTFIDDIYTPHEPVYFALEMKTGELVYRSIPGSFYTGLAAAKAALASFDLRREAMVRAFDHVIGPAIGLINAFRLESPPVITVAAFGQNVPAPRCSIVVPLYGRIDFLEYQLAFFSATLAADHELIYVLDDPSRLSATQALAASCYARFGRSFTLVCLSENRGYAPANNVGLRQARGTHVCFLNSDVFPDAPDWLEHLLQTLDGPGQVGVAGGYLIYEDGTLQHDGISFNRLAEFGDWIFPDHLRKGRRVDAPDGLLTVPAVTGACMVMRRGLAKQMDGFDEGYVIGDFEDVDLCMKIRAQGFTCVVDPRARLFHLERQSQGDSAHAWRMNLTLYNAWRFNKRWALELQQTMGPS